MKVKKRKKKQFECYVNFVIQDCNVSEKLPHNLGGKKREQKS
jgi:hypothetical protein